MEFRKEKDTMGVVEVPAHVYWGAQTQRSIDNFKIAQDINKMPKEIIKAFAYLKKAAAITNYEAGVLPKEKSDIIGKVCDEILEGNLDEIISLPNFAIKRFPCILIYTIYIGVGGHCFKPLNHFW